MLAVVDGDRDPAATTPDRPVEFDMDDLTLGAGVRLCGLRGDHIARLCELGGRWPPLLVTRDEHVIVDGAHRYQAARLLGLKRIACDVFDGGSDEAFVEAVRLNVRQGLPLSLREREAAARRILGLHGDWSDRWVGDVCGLSHGTVAAVRAAACSTGDLDRSNRRTGQDGRSRPVDSAAVREAIVKAIEQRPEASLRTIATIVGSSPSTVRNVRAAMVRGPEHLDWDRSAPQSWKSDRALATADRGEEFTQWFDQSAVDDRWEAFVDVPPLSRIYELSDEARRRARSWIAFADALERRARTDRP